MDQPNDSTFWRYKVHADIRGDSLGMRRQMTVVVVDNGNFQRIFNFQRISSETLEIRPAIVYSDTQSVVGFSMIPKCVTLNDLE